MDTKQYGWPISAPVKIVGSKVFIDARIGLTPYGYFNEKQCKRGVFKQLEQFLKHYGLQDTDIYMDKTCKDYISAEAFILALIAGIKLRDPTRNQIQFAWRKLCMFFTAIITKATFGKENQNVGTANITTCTTVTTSTPNTVLCAEPMIGLKTITKDHIQLACLFPWILVSLERKVLAQLEEKHPIPRSVYNILNQ